MLRIDPGVKEELLWRRKGRLALPGLWHGQARRADRLESHSQRQCCIGEKSFPEEAL